MALVAETRAQLPPKLFPLMEQLRTCTKYQQVQTGGGTAERQTGRQEAPLTLADRAGLVTVL